MQKKSPLTQGSGEGKRGEKDAEQNQKFQRTAVVYSQPL